MGGILRNVSLHHRASLIMAMLLRVRGLPGFANFAAKSPSFVRME